MAENITNNNWYPFANGSTIGKLGSESGSIIDDIEHPEGARITIDKDGDIAPFSITLGVYGFLMHTHFASSESEARQFAIETKERIEKLFTHLAIPPEEQDENWSDIKNALASEICEQS